MTLDLRSHFSIFRGAAPHRIHLAAHSHHFWPDRACAAHANAVTEAARSADNKWTAIFADLIPRVQRGIARVLNLPDARTIAVAPNTHEQLESFYAVPQIGAVLVPINFRLTAEDFVYITSHSGAKVLCVHPDYIAAVDDVRDQLRGVEHFVVLGKAAPVAPVT